MSQRDGAKHWVVDLDSRYTTDAIGFKAANLQRLARAGFQIPTTLVCRWEAYEAYQQNQAGLMEQLHQELTQKIGPNTPYAVRSSANLEDQTNFTFAGMFESYLNIRGVNALLDAVRQVWQAASSQRVQAYQKKQQLESDCLKMVVIIQELIQPVYSGVAFSCNPVNGAAEVIIEAVEGSGVALVQAGATPMRWVHRNGQWAAAPEKGPLNLEVAAEIVRQSRAIVRKMHQEVDLEWIYDGRQLYWVQMRGIHPPNQNKVYSNRLAKDMLPGQICPLVWSVNIPLVNGVWIDLLSEVIGDTGLQPQDLARAFYYRTYFEMGAFGRIFRIMGMPEQSIEMMIGIEPVDHKMPGFKPTWSMLRFLPRLIRFIIDKVNLDRRLVPALPALQADFQAIAAMNLETLDETALQDCANRLKEVVRRAAYFNITVPLLMSIYNQILRRQLKSSGIDSSELDMAVGEAIKEFDPGRPMQELNHLFLTLDEPLREQIRTASWADFQQMSGMEPFKQAFNAYLEKYGHLSDSGNDFSVTPWREQPEVILQMIASLPPSPAGSRASRLQFEDLQLPPLKKWMVRKIFQRTCRYRLYREQISSTYTFGYGLFRGIYQTLGRRLTDRGVLASPADIFMLSWEEIQAVLAKDGAGMEYSALTQQRRLDMEQCRSIVLPSIIYGTVPPPLDLPTSQTLLGTPTSNGVYTGPVVVVSGIQDFHKVKPGDVLVVPNSDVGWTPLFVQAGAVIAESGGLLSHSSIIAREYNIPAIVSVEHATLLTDRALVTVDGYRGTVTVH